MFGCRLGLVQTRQAAVVALVQTPAANHGQPHLVCALHDGPQGLDGSFQHGGVAHVKLEARVLDGLCSALCLPHALLAEVGIEPAAEAVLLVPGALAVADDDQAVHSSHGSSV